MEHEALKDLRLILLEPRESLRIELFKEWTSKWLYNTKKVQYVVNKSVLNTEEIDFTWYNVATQCAYDLIDNQITSNDTTNNSFSCELLAIKSPNKIKKITS